MSFRALLKLLYIDKETYINALQVKLKRPTIFLQRLCKDIQTIPLVFTLEIFGKQTHMFNSYLTLIVHLVITHLI
jgi:hypothetical protein